MKKLSLTCALAGVCLALFVFAPSPTLAYTTTTVSGSINSDTTWQSDYIYVVSGAISINARLTVQAGAIVKFNGSSAGLNVNNGGILDVQGSGTATTSKAIFTSYKDDTGGDTNGDGGSSGTSGDWDAIILNSGASSTMAYALVRYGGASNYMNIYNKGGVFTLNSVEVANSLYHGIESDSGTSTIISCTIRDNPRYGIYAWGGTLIFNNNAFSGNGFGAAQLNFGSGLTFANSGNTVGEHEKGIFLKGNSLSTDLAWNGDGVPYIVDGYFTAGSGKRLSIGAGAILKFYNGSSGLTINNGGILDAQGTGTATSEKVIFTSYKDDTGGDTDNSASTPAGGDWDNLTFSSGASGTIAYALIRYGGSNTYNNIKNEGNLSISHTEISNSNYHGMYQSSGTSTIVSSDIHHNPYKGLYVLGGTASVSSSSLHNNDYGAYASACTLTLIDNTFYANSTDVYAAPGVTYTHSGDARLESGSITSDTTWNNDYIHVVSDTLTVNSGKALTINPGTIVKFNSESSKMTVNGWLRAIGTTTSSIYFTSIHDDQGGNTDGVSTTPAAGDWDTIAFNSNSSGTITFAMIRYGDHAGTNGSLYNDGGDISLAHTDIATSTNYGIKQTDGALQIAFSHIYEATYGVNVAGGTVNLLGSGIYGHNRGLNISEGELTIAGSELVENSFGIYATGGTITATSTAILDNSVFGIYSSSPIIQASYNYWGDSSGPYNLASNPFGTGDNVSDNVIFIPWNSDAHYLQGATGVNSNGTEMQWTGSTTFTTAFAAGCDTWNNEGRINIHYVGSSPDITVSDIDDEDTAWAGKYFYLSYELKFNIAKLRGQTPEITQHVATHEVGHALGLDHSYPGNVMVTPATSQTKLGWQDWRDYHYIWGY